MQGPSTPRIYMVAVSAAAKDEHKGFDKFNKHQLPVYNAGPLHS